MIQLKGYGNNRDERLLQDVLTLSMVSQRAFQLDHFRADAESPGIQRAHLELLRASARLCNAEHRGLHLKSQRITFLPGVITEEHHRVVLGNGKSAVTALLTLAPALIAAGGTSTLEVVGSTHSEDVPPFEWIERVLVPRLSEMGIQANSVLKRVGFPPAGGGECSLQLSVPDVLRPLNLPKGPSEQQSVMVRAGHIPESVPQHLLELLEEAQGLPVSSAEIISSTDAPSPGVAILVTSSRGGREEVFAAIGALGKSSGKVIKELVTQLRQQKSSGTCLSGDSGERLLPFIALAGEGCLHTGPPTRRYHKISALIGLFLDLEVSCERLPNERGRMFCWKLRPMAEKGEEESPPGPKVS